MAEPGSLTLVAYRMAEQNAYGEKYKYTPTTPTLYTYSNTDLNSLPHLL